MSKSNPTSQNRTTTKRRPAAGRTRRSRKDADLPGDAEQHELIGTATNQNSCRAVKSKPTLASSAALTLHSSQTEKPRCSAKIENARFRRATRLPVVSQNVGSSGSQCSIQRPAERAGCGGAVGVGAEVVVVAVLMAEQRARVV